VKSFFQDRFFAGILIGIVLLVALALGLYFLRSGQGKYVDDSNPAGALHNYLVAVRSQDYQKAYSYLADDADKPDYSDFSLTFKAAGRNSIEFPPVEIGETLPGLNGDSATVMITLQYKGQGLFDGSSYQSDLAVMVLQNGAWKVRTAPYQYRPPLYLIPQLRTATPTPHPPTPTTIIHSTNTQSP
jgi:hypothetical protein